jgi:hypothetical protein
MTQVSAAALLSAGLVLGALAGIFGSLYVERRRAKVRRRIPTHWPLDPRNIVSSAERRVWHWLNRVFFDHHIMVKLPVTRFTLPQGKENGGEWYRILTGVYCTFTVCASDGRVVGCVDVLGPAGISRTNRQLKLTLLSQCGVSYMVVKPDSLPPLPEIRTEFLGDAGSESAHRQREIQTQAHKLRTSVERLRQRRQTIAPARIQPATALPIGVRSASSARPIRMRARGSSPIRSWRRWTAGAPNCGNQKKWAPHGAHFS